MAEEFMDKESWIASRTDNPDRLGKDAWGKVYDANVSLYRKDEVTKGSGVTEDVLKKMIEEFISTQGLSCNLTDSIQLDTAKTLFRFVMKGDEFQSKSGYQMMLDIAAKTSAKVKKRMEQENAAKNEATNGKSELKKTLASGASKGNSMMSKGKISSVRRSGSVYGG